MALFKRKPSVPLTPEEERMEKAKAMAKAYLLRKKVTIEDVAKKFNCSRTTVCNYFNKVLLKADTALYEKVKAKREAVKTELRAQFKKNPQVLANIEKVKARAKNKEASEN